VLATVAKIEKYNQVNMKIKMQKIPKGASDAVLDALMGELAEVTAKKKLIAGLGVPAMKPRHWLKVFELLKEPVPPNLESMTLQSLLDIDAAKYSDEIDDISGAAQGELQIETQLGEVKERWDELEFVVIPYRDFKDKFLISGVDDLIMQLEDDQMTVGTMMGSKFVAEVRDDVEEME
jgi:dynein heavy chain